MCAMLSSQRARRLLGSSFSTRSSTPIARVDPSRRVCTPWPLIGSRQESRLWPRTQFCSSPQRISVVACSISRSTSAKTASSWPSARDVLQQVVDEGDAVGVAPGEEQLLGQGRRARRRGRCAGAAGDAAANASARRSLTLNQRSPGADGGRARRRAARPSRACSALGWTGRLPPAAPRRRRARWRPRPTRRRRRRERQAGARHASRLHRRRQSLTWKNADRVASPDRRGPARAARTCLTRAAPAGSG